MAITTYQPQMTQLFQATNESPGLEQVYKTYLDQIAATGVLLFNHYEDVEAPSYYGDYGALDYQGEAPSASPKYRALLDFKAE
jgi:hypothetical protein